MIQISLIVLMILSLATSLKRFSVPITFSRISRRHKSPSSYRTDSESKRYTNRRSTDHREPTDDRDWTRAVTFWRDVIKHPHSMPDFVKGDDKYGITDLQPVFRAGDRFEFQSKDPRYTGLSTYALSFGYDGTKFFGYQSQRNTSARAVEDVLREAVGLRCVAAGRTDRNVSAIGQVISFSSNKPDCPNVVLGQLRAHPAVVRGKD